MNSAHLDGEATPTGGSSLSWLAVSEAISSHRELAALVHALNGAAIRTGLLESALFGHKKSVLTGASSRGAPPEWRLRPLSGAGRVAPPSGSPARLVPLWSQLDTHPCVARERREGNCAGTAPAIGGKRERAGARAETTRENREPLAFRLE